MLYVYTHRFIHGYCTFHFTNQDQDLKLRLGMACQPEIPTEHPTSCQIPTNQVAEKKHRRQFLTSKEKL